MKLRWSLVVAVLLAAFMTGFPSWVDAGMKIRAGGGAIMKAWLKSSMYGAYRSHSSFSTQDRSWCESGDDLEATYICDSLSESKLSLKKSAIEEAEERVNLASLTVNQYSSASVNSYNALVRSSNTAVAEYNASLQSECVQLAMWCKPLTCHAKYPGTSYKKDTDSCLCENGMEWDIATQCKSPTESRVSASRSSSGSSDSVWWAVFLVIIGWWIIVSLVKKTQ